MMNNQLPFWLPNHPDMQGFWLPEKQGYKIVIPNGALLYIPFFLTQSERTYLLPYLLKSIEWEQETTQVLDKTTAWYGDKNVGYDSDKKPKNWNVCLLAIKEKVAAVINRPFNSVLLNWYRDENGSLGWHSDNDPKLGKNPIIALLSFGDCRTLLLRNKHEDFGEIQIPLQAGSLLVMAGAIQEHWVHSITKSQSKQTDHLYLTFTYIKTI